MVEPLLNTLEAAGVLGVSVHTLVSWRRPECTTPLLPYTRVGRLVFYHRVDLHRLLNRRCYPGADPARGRRGYPLREVDARPVSVQDQALAA